MCNNKPVETPLKSQAIGEVASKTHVIGTVFESASRGVGASNSEELKNYEHAGVRLFIDVTNVGGAGTVTVKIQVKDPVSGLYVDLAGAVTAALAAVATTILTVHPSVTETANVRVSQHIGLSWRIVATVAGNAVTFTIGAEYLIGG